MTLRHIKILLVVVVTIGLSFIAAKMMGQAGLVGWNGSLIPMNGAGYYWAGHWFPTIQSGHVATGIGQFSQVITFNAPFADTNYAVSLSAPSSSTALMTYQSKTSNGFTVSISVPFVGTVDYTAVADQP